MVVLSSGERAAFKRALRQIQARSKLVSHCRVLQHLEKLLLVNIHCCLLTMHSVAGDRFISLANGHACQFARI